MFVTYIFYLFFFFFFSSRRRHTRCLSDWSSDVCSSDLGLFIRDSYRAPRFESRMNRPRPGSRRAPKIGRASCRERVEMTDVGGCIKEKNIIRKEERWVTSVSNDESISRRREDT